MQENKKALDRAMRLLSTRAHTESELREKLLSKKFSKAAAEWAIEECKRYNFLNDEEFAKIYLEELKYKNHGIFRIKAALRKKGLSNDIIEELLSEEDIFTTDRERAETALDGKMKSLIREKDGQKRKQKAYRFLVSRGFSPDAINPALSKYDFSDG